MSISTRRVTATQVSNRRSIGGIATRFGAAALATVTLLAAPGTSEAASSDGATSYCMGESAVSERWKPVRSPSQIIVNFPTRLATGQTSVGVSQQQQRSGVRNAVVLGDQLRAPRSLRTGVQQRHEVLDSAENGSVAWGLSDSIGTAPAGSSQRVVQERYVLTAAGWSQPTYELVNNILC